VFGYRLTRTSDRTYKSEVNISLVPAKGENISAQALSKLRDNIGECLEGQSKNLKGANAESLTIQLTTDPSIPRAIIEVTDKPIRENQFKYSTHMDCPMFLHEILHLHGLVDEYKEEAIGFKFNPENGQFEFVEEKSPDDPSAFDCRVLGTEDSVMRNEWKGVVATNNLVLWKYVVCSKTSGEQAPPGIRCPQGTYPAYREILLNPGEKFQAIDFEKTAPSFKPRIIGRLRKTRPSILEPAQFLAITRPGCFEENALYYACARTANLSTLTKANQPINAVLNCPAQPPECKDPKIWLSGRPWRPTMPSPKNLDNSLGEEVMR
jgi:hypothetical protein